MVNILDILLYFDFSYFQFFFTFVLNEFFFNLQGNCFRPGISDPYDTHHVTSDSQDRGNQYWHYNNAIYGAENIYCHSNSLDHHDSSDSSGYHEGGNYDGGNGDCGGWGDSGGGFGGSI